MIYVTLPPSNVAAHYDRPVKARLQIWENTYLFRTFCTNILKKNELNAIDIVYPPINICIVRNSKADYRIHIHTIEYFCEILTTSLQSL